MLPALTGHHPHLDAATLQGCGTPASHALRSARAEDQAPATPHPLAFELETRLAHVKCVKDTRGLCTSECRSAARIWELHRSMCVEC
jgi:hypothetical protein